MTESEEWISCKKALPKMFQKVSVKKMNGEYLDVVLRSKQNTWEWPSGIFADILEASDKWKIKDEP